MSFWKSSLVSSPPSRISWLTSSFDEVSAQYMSYMNEQEKELYIKFLSEFLKGKSYVEMCYMTGIMPINTFDIGTPLNMFDEFIMGRNNMYAEYFGFDEIEVDKLYQTYLYYWKNDSAIARQELSQWYDGYYQNGRRLLYNPKSVVSALSMNQLDSYWSSSGLI